MWEQVFVAQHMLEAEMLKSVLEAEGLTVYLEPLGVPHLGDARDTAILVPEEQAELARGVLASAREAENDAPASDEEDDF